MQSVSCLTADKCLTADPEVPGPIPYVEIDHEIISMVILLPSADSRSVVSYKQKYMHKQLQSTG